MSNAKEPGGQSESIRLPPGSGMKQMVVSRLKEFLRRPEAVFWVYVFPLLMVVVLGIAFRNKPVESLVVDAVSGNDAFAEQLEQASEGKEDVEVRFWSEEECRARLKAGKSSIYIRPAATPPEVEFIFDPTRPGSLLAKQKMDDLLQRQSGRVDMLNNQEFEFQEEGGRYIDWLIPGLLGMGLMGGGLWGVGFAIVDMRIRKLLKRFLATPMKRSHYLISIMISRLLFMVPEMILLLVFARVFFQVKVQGGLIDVILLILIGSIQFSGIGLLIASRCRTMESVSGLMNLVMLPMWTLCGIFFSYENFPKVVHPLIQLLPLTPLIDSLRAVMMEGTSIVMLWPQILVMAAWGLITFAIALAIFRWGD